MDTVQQRRLLGLIGLGVRGRGAIVGVEKVRDAAKRGKLKLLNPRAQTPHETDVSA